jgi:F-type H+-transporting ATPase subunit delta
VRPSPVARRYAEAAFQVAHQDGNTAEWLEQLRTATRVLSDAEVARLFKDPSVSRSVKLLSLERLFPGFRPRVLNLLRMLTVRTRLYLLPAFLREFEALDRQERGILEAEVTVARPLTDAERSDVEQRLRSSTGKAVEVETHVDPEILGGIIVRVGDRLFDASVAGRLERLRHQMAT